MQTVVVKPACPHFSNCSGCSMQELTVQEQLEQKSVVLMEEFAIYNLHPEQILAPATGPLWHYRYRARLSVRWVLAKNRLLIGFREPGGRYVADMDSCEILPLAVSKLLPILQKTLGKLQIAASIPQLEVAVGTSPMEIAIVLRHLVPIGNADMQILLGLAKTHNIKLYLQSGGLNSIKLYWPQDTSELLGYALPEYKLEFKFLPSEFTQINPELNKDLVSTALSWLEITANDEILELFCGLGNFTLPLALNAKSVVAVEGSEQLILRARNNAALNKITNIEFEVADLKKNEADFAFMHRKYTKVVLDPPRAGAEEILPAIAATKAAAILYISCNATTLAKDLDVLINSYGYKLSKVQIFDMFSHTKHWETMVLLTKA